MVREYEIVGKPFPKIDGPAKVSGASVYAGDVILPNMLYAKVMRSPHAHAKVVSIDTSKAKTLPGVKAVLTSNDAPTALADKARYVGDAIAAVAATSLEVAEEALKLIDVKYNILSAVFDTDEAMKSGAPQIHDTGNIVGAKPTYILKSGDTEAGFKAADKVFEMKHYLEHHHMSPMGPYSCTAVWDKDRLTLWSSNQSASDVGPELAPILGIPVNHIRVIATYVGSGYGQHIATRNYVEPIAVLLARKASQPVRLVYTRQEEINNIYTRKRGIGTLKVGVKNDGTITAVEYDLIHDVGAYLWASHASGSGRGVYQGFRNKNVRYTCTEVYTNKTPGGGFRAWGKEYGCAVMNPMLDMIAESLGMDVLDLYYKNLYDVGETMDPTVARPVIRNTAGIREALRLGAELIGWKLKRTPPVQKTGAIRSGIGCALHVRDGGTSAAEAIVKVHPDTSVFVTVACNDPGNGSRTCCNQAAAEVLHADFNKVSQSPVDTLDAPYGAGATASKGARSNAYAVKVAAEDAMRKILDLAAPMLKVNAADLELRLRDGIIFVKADPSKTVKLRDVMGAFKHVIGVGQTTPQSMVTSQAVFSEVEVDTETGGVFVKNHIAVNDPGVALNPLVCTTNLFGGNLQGLGFVVLNGGIWDPVTGYPLHASHEEYKLPTFLDFGKIDADTLVQVDSGLEPYGAGGPGEATPMSAKPAILNAIYNAIGVRLTSIPVTPEHILKALGKI